MSKTNTKSNILEHVFVTTSTVAENTTDLLQQTMEFGPNPSKEIYDMVDEQLNNAKKFLVSTKQIIDLADDAASKSEAFGELLRQYERLSELTLTAEDWLTKCVPVPEDESEDVESDEDEMSDAEKAYRDYTATITRCIKSAGAEAPDYVKEDVDNWEMTQEMTSKVIRDDLKRNNRQAAIKTAIGVAATIASIPVLVVSDRAWKQKRYAKSAISYLIGLVLGCGGSVGALDAIDKRAENEKTIAEYADRGAVVDVYTRK